ncbi:two-component system response regulator [Brevibacillus reuszeri]|uniref:Chemotaxis protein CheY n=1 Tax=Brevibacillus reuszeri TaxID=54915 RepID=A0A0K9YTR1_9BACL|nr:HD domain-containing phosphohydrolase [Brevibacillus reuszeri]KNB71585.1 chemotaxis protein CheY [Brevibacillus reuszeri]MED1855600.1 response regulator [Brevibacillus reuszeri]GED67250.1 two-component system response regulator [Brevibacillus reuszeri]
MNEVWRANATFLIVDDQEYNLSLLERILRRAGYTHLHCTTDPKQMEQLYDELKPDIILIDLHMPEMDGFTLLKRLQELKPEGDYLPILVLTADVTQEAKKEALHLGANDFLTKPLDKTEVVLRINNCLRTRFYNIQLQDQNQRLEQRVQERTTELEKAKNEILQLLARTSEFRDDDTGQHTVRVAQMAEEIAIALGLPPQEVRLINRATPLHDIGKIGIPDEILLKPGRFTPEEFLRMKEHTTIGASILEGSQFSVLQLAQTIAITHHEKWDGTGYPNGLKGEEIPLAGRIVALADFYDALTNERPYKRAWTRQEAIAEIKKQRGAHFDPMIVDVFLEIVGEDEQFSTAEEERALQR